MGRDARELSFRPVVDSSRLAQLPCFAELSDEQRTQASDLLEEVVVSAGAEVAVQGDFAYHFFVVEDGTAEVRENGARVAELGPGDFFGELALLRDGPRSASVVAATDLRVRVIPRQEFGRSMRRLPTLAHSVRAAAVTR